ncbi:MAG TPA: hypothetical protein VF115_03540 [Acidimicrobiia bacterium]
METMMYVYYFVHLDGEPRTWAHRLETDGHWFRGLATGALHGVRREPRGEDLMEIGRSRPIGRGFSIPVDWSAPGLFVGFEGDVSLQPLEIGVTQMSIRGSYRSDPPDDDRGNHRKVEAVVKHLLDSISLDS